MGKRLAFPHKVALWPRDEGSRPETISAAQRNQAFFGAKVLHPYCYHSAFSSPPCFLLGPLAAAWEVFLSLMEGWGGGVGFCLHLWMEIFDMNHHVISVFMNANDIDAHIAVWASRYQKQQIIILWGVFTVFVMSGSLLVADVSSVWEKNLEMLCAFFWQALRSP